VMVERPLTRGPQEDRPQQATTTHTIQVAALHGPDDVPLIDTVGALADVALTRVAIDADAPPAPAGKLLVWVPALDTAGLELLDLDGEWAQVELVFGALDPWTTDPFLGAVALSDLSRFGPAPRGVPDAPATIAVWQRLLGHHIDDVTWPGCQVATCRWLADAGTLP